MVSGHQLARKETLTRKVIEDGGACVPAAVLFPSGESDRVVHLSDVILDQLALVGQGSMV